MPILWLTVAHMLQSPLLKMGIINLLHQSADSVSNLHLSQQACQPTKPTDVQSFQNLKTNLIHNGHPATEELLTYLRDLCLRRRVHFRWVQCPLTAIKGVKINTSPPLLTSAQAKPSLLESSNGFSISFPRRYHWSHSPSGFLTPFCCLSKSPGSFKPGRLPSVL